MQITRARYISFISVATALFGLFTVTMSMRYGQLALPITYDDNGYFLDALRRIHLFANSDLIEAFHDYRRNAPHSVYSTFVAMTAFMTLGVRMWAPAALQALLVAPLLLFVRREFIDMRIFMLAAVAVLCWPVVSFMVIDTRPDIICAGLTAFASLEAVRRPWLSAPRSRRVLLSSLIGIATLAKPSIAPLTFASFGLAVLLASLIDWRRERAPVVRPNLEAAVVVLLWCALYSVPGWKAIIDYILFATASPTAYLWYGPSGVLRQALYYIIGEGGRMMMGWWALASVGVGLLALFFVPVVDKSRSTATGLVAMFLYAAVSVPMMKSPYLGVIVSWIALIFFVRGLGTISRAEPRVAIALAAVLALVGVATYQTQWQKRSGSHTAMEPAESQKWQTLLDEVAGTIEKSAPNARVFLTGTAQYLNGTTLELRAVADGYPGITADDDRMKGKGADLGAYLAKNDVIVAFSPDSHDYLTWLPNVENIAALSSAVKADSNFRQIVSFPGVTGGQIEIYKKEK